MHFEQRNTPMTRNPIVRRAALSSALAVLASTALATVRPDYPWLRYLSPTEIERELEQMAFLYELERLAGILHAEICAATPESDFKDAGADVDPAHKVEAGVSGAVAEEENAEDVDELENVDLDDSVFDDVEDLTAAPAWDHASFLDRESRECIREELARRPALARRGIMTAEDLDRARNATYRRGIRWNTDLELYIAKLSLLTRGDRRASVVWSSGAVQTSGGKGGAFVGIASGDTVHTGHEGRARVALHDGALRLGPSGRIGATAPTTWSLATDTQILLQSQNERRTTIVTHAELERGLIRVLQNPADPARSPEAEPPRYSDPEVEQQQPKEPPELQLRAGTWILVLRLAHSVIDWDPQTERLTVHHQSGSATLESDGRRIVLRPGSSTTVLARQGTEPDSEPLDPQRWQEVVRATGDGKASSEDLL